MLLTKQEVLDNLYPQLIQIALLPYAVPKRMYKKDGSVGQSEKYSGLNEKKLSLMKGDKVVKMAKEVGYAVLFLSTGQ